ncbi:MAG TPA: hypothetical protein VJZ71_10330 [Phycisphaerae bacterium]|nr:hypothetical protein [Phycisphaerae bacterium]
MDSDVKHGIRRAVCVLALALWGAIPLRGQEPRPLPLPPDQLKQANEVMEAAKKIGPWESQSQVLEDATDQIFSQHNWNSEPDQFARQLMRDVGRIAPWNPHQRQEVFLNAVQERLMLTHDQRTQLDSAFRQETMTFAMRHFKDIVPIVLEVAKTRANNEPFTPEQVQEWSNRMRPMMDEGMQVIQRVASRLDKSMTAEQRELLQADLRAFVHRHDDMKKMVEKWQAGNWSPADWGLQNDPVHAGSMAEHRAREAEKNALVEAARSGQKPDEATAAVDESAWDKYVKWFCHAYECEERQRVQAEAILKKSKKEAITYREHKKEAIAQWEGRIVGEKDGAKLVAAQAELQRLLAPISQTFDRMKRQLASLLTVSQRQKFGDPLAVEQTAKRAS